MKRSISLFRKVLIGYLISIPVFIALVAATIMCFINLKTYAVYYAERTPHSDNVDPVAIEIIENLGWNEFPAGGIYNGDFDGKNTLRLMNPIKNKVKVSFTSDVVADGEKYSFHYISETGWSYFLDSNLYPTWGADPDYTVKTQFSDKEKSEVQQEVKLFLAPMVAVQPKPETFNLQWLYDLLNHSRFN